LRTSCRQTDKQTHSSQYSTTPLPEGWSKNPEFPTAGGGGTSPYCSSYRTAAMIRRNITPCVGATGSIIGKCDVIRKTGSKYRIATQQEEERSTATGDMQRKFGRLVTAICVRTCRQTDRQSDRHTHHNTSHSSHPSRGGVKILYRHCWEFSLSVCSQLRGGSNVATAPSPAIRCLPQLTPK